MPTQSIVFSPELDERQLSKETKQLNQELNQSAQDIQPNFDASGLDSLRAGGGGGRGGGMGASTVGAAGLASRLPKPVAGVSVASALPVALGGAVGVGMLNAMHGASARLQTSTSLLGQAWNNVWRPMGDKVDQLFVRDPVMDLVSATQDFETAFRQADWLVDPLAQTMKSVFMKDATGFVVNLGDLAMNIEEQIEWPTVKPSEVIGGIGWPTIGSGNVIGSMDWPTLTLDAVLDALMNKDGGGGGTSYTSSITRNRDGDPLSGTRGRGGVVSGPDQNSSTGRGGSSPNTPGSGGNARMPEVETRLDETNRNLRELKDAMHNMEIAVDKETLGRVTDDSQRNRIAGNDPTVL